MNLSVDFPGSGAIARLWGKTRNRQSIFHMATVVFKTNIALQVLLALGSVLLIRSVPKADYGLWRVIASTTAFIPLLFGGLDEAVYRFLPVGSRRDGDSVAFAAFSAKAAVTFVGVSILIVLYPSLPNMLNVPGDMHTTFDALFWLAIGSTLLTPLVSTMFAVASAHKQLEMAFRVSVAKQAAVFLCVLVIVGLHLTLVHYAACELVLSTAQAVVLWRVARPKSIEKGGDLWRPLTTPGRWALLKHGWRSYLAPYAAPLNVASGLSYIRGNVPVILLGSQFSLQSAAIYSIFRNLLTTLHKTEGGILAGVMPRIFEMYDTNREGFLRKFNRWTSLLYGTRFATGAVILIGSPLLFWLYKIEPSAYLTLVLAILVLEFLMSEVINISNMIVMMSKRTTMLMVSASVRFVFEILLLWFVTRRYGILGAAITLFLARTSETIATVRAANQVVRMRQQSAMCAIVLAVFTILLVTVWRFAAAGALVAPEMR